MNKAQNLLQRDSCLNKARFDEPLFVLRANDPLAPAVVRLWAEMHRGQANQNAPMGPPGTSKADQATKVADEMEAWRKGRTEPPMAPAPIAFQGQPMPAMPGYDQLAR